MSEQADKHQKVIVNIAQRLQDKGEKVGLEKGLDQSMREAKMTMARSLLKNGVSLELIIECTDLSHEELVSLQ